MLYTELINIRPDKGERWQGLRTDSRRRLHPVPGRENGVILRCRGESGMNAHGGLGRA